jgi:hypothetical protein
MGTECEVDFTYTHTKHIVQGDSGGKMNIVGCDCFVRCEKESLYEHVSNSEWEPRCSCLNPQT